MSFTRFFDRFVTLSTRAPGTIKHASKSRQMLRFIQDIKLGWLYNVGDVVFTRISEKQCILSLQDRYAISGDISV
jgi:hypothetical protein